MTYSSVAHATKSFAGNNGLGFESCRQLCKHNAHVYLAARNPSKAESAIADIKKDNPEANVTYLNLDLSSLESVQKAADEFNAQSDRLDVLMNNGTFYYHSSVPQMVASLSSNDHLMNTLLLDFHVM